MNEKKSLKLHKSHKIVCFIVCFVIIFATFGISAFADTPSPTQDNTYLIEAGTYVWNDEVVGLDTFPNYSINVPITFTCSPIVVIEGNDIIISPGTLTFNSIALNSSFFTPVTSIQYAVDADNALPVYVGYDVNNDTFWKWNGLYEGLSYLGATVPTELKGYGKTITILEDTYVPYDFGIWASANWTKQTYDYDGNPWVDILKGVLTALDVKIFGTFSYLDIVSTLAGACLAIWLLKMLAGG